MRAADFAVAKNFGDLEDFVEVIRGVERICVAKKSLHVELGGVVEVKGDGMPSPGTVLEVRR